MLRAGVVGAGVFGGHHASKYVGHPDTGLVTVFDPDQGRAEALAEKTGCDAVASFEDLIERVDLLTIASPADTHANLAKQAIHAGKHVYVEKPLALSTEDAQSIVKLARAEGVEVFVGHQERLVLDAVGTFDRIKDPSALEFARCCPPSGRCEDVSVVWDLMIHDLDIAAKIVGSRAVDIDASGSDHEVSATVTFANGCRASFFASRRSEAAFRKMTATSGERLTTIDFLARSLTETYKGDRTVSGFEGAIADPVGDNVNAFVQSVLFGRYAEVSRSLYGSVATGVTAADAVQSVSLAENIEFKRRSQAVVVNDRIDGLEQERLTA
ncbi:MAG: Gfo/Idh/MocA family oxidoreductase [Pseudomonadota bacterium]